MTGPGTGPNTGADGAPESGADGAPDSAAKLSHVDDDGRARMVDVTAKDVTNRQATATGAIHTTAEVLDLLATGSLPKGDALATARLAGIMGAKRTSDLVPLCHPIGLSGIDVELTPDPSAAAIRITATTRTADRTGVEMEALTAVAVAGLTVIDMIKAVDPAASLDSVQCQQKQGGKTGRWQRPADR